MTATRETAAQEMDKAATLSEQQTLLLDNWGAIINFPQVGGFLVFHRPNKGPVLSPS